MRDKPFWSRTKVGVAAGVVGLVIGMSGSGSEAEQGQAKDDSVSALRADLAEVLEQKSALEDDLVAAESDLGEVESGTDEALRELRREAKVAQRKAVSAAVAKTRKQEQQKLAAAVKAAREQAQAAAAPSSAPVPLAATGGGTDPRFSYCYEANDAGYGPYVRGQDPEYDWYDDRDGDGVVCEY